MKVKKPCPHGRYEEHRLGSLSSELVEPYYIVIAKDGDYDAYICVCPGGEDMELERWTGFSFSMSHVLGDPNKKVWVSTTPQG